MQNLIRKILFLLLFFSANYSKAQDSLKVRQDSLKAATKSNRIYFYEGYVGFGGAKTAGWTAGVTLNYQFFRTDLLTARVSTFIGYESEVAMLGPVIGFPVFIREEKIADYGLLYGKRWIRGGVSFNVSAGVSFVRYDFLKEEDSNYIQKRKDFFGVPFELSLKFFKNIKRRLRLYYGIIPVTKQKVAFGRSIGFKLVGNLSGASYTGFAISYGFGCHKKY